MTPQDDLSFHELDRFLLHWRESNLRGDMAADLHQAGELLLSMRSLLQTLDQENSQLRQELEQSVQSRAAFVSLISHELRIPMTAIRGYADLLRQGVVGPLNDLQLNFVDVIRNNVERMASLVSDLSDLTKIESGRIKFEHLPFEPKARIEVVLNRLQELIEAKHHRVQLELPIDLPGMRLDPQRFEQVMTNLIKNACMYTPEGGAITVRARYTPSEPIVHFEVQDTGIGVRAEDQENLFTQFFRSDEAFVREQPGWGLGLSVSKALVEALGGRVGFSSAPGGGSIFWFVLPLDERTGQAGLPDP